MTDQLERLLRDQFAHDAEQAPGGHTLMPSQVAAAGRASVRAHRRRKAGIGAVAVAALVVVPFALSGGAGDRHGAEPATHASPSATTTIAEGSLRFRGVRVPVPGEMLSPQNRLCGTSTTDAAWVTRGNEVTNSCAITGSRADRTEVELTEIDPSLDTDQSSGSKVLPDGRTRTVRPFDDRALWLVVTAPDAARARLLANSATATAPEGQIDGCRVKDLGDRFEPDISAASSGPLMPEDPVAGNVCGYEDGWLVASQTLGSTAAARLAEEINAAPVGISAAVRDCKPNDPLDSTGFWRVGLIPEGLAQVNVDVTPRSCSEGAAGVTEDGRIFELTDSLAQRLDKLAAGPSRW